MGCSARHDSSRLRHIDPSGAFEALGTQRRRTVVRLLAATDGQTQLADLAADVAERDGLDRQRAAAELHHRTLPKLSALDVVEYDNDERVAAPRPAVDDLTPLLQYLEYKEAEC